jgi:hypothetical protein
MKKIKNKKKIKIAKVIGKIYFLVFSNFFKIYTKLEVKKLGYNSCPLFRMLTV